MANNRSSKHIDLSWGDGRTELFLAPCKGGLELLDYEYDFYRIHQLCGGRCYYQSRSGASGAGYIERYAELTRVGYYRVDTVHKYQNPIKIAGEVSVMLPYSTHVRDKRSILKTHPVVIRMGYNTVIYCGYYTNFTEVLKRVLSEEGLQQEPRHLRRTFVDVSVYGQKFEQEVEIKFYNLFGYSHWPWEFVTDIVEPARVPYPMEPLYRIFHLSNLKDGTMVRTARIGSDLFASGILEGDPLENLQENFPGWELGETKGETNMLYKVRENSVYIVGWQLAEAAYQKRIERIARFIPDSEKEGFKSFVQKDLPSSKYVEFELYVPKILFFLNKEKQFAIVRKGIATKVREDLAGAFQLFVENFNDNQILEAIPDDLVIKMEDSLEAGNCRPGTQAFADRYFPGKTEVTAGELKRFAKKWSVMRIFRYLASREQIIGKVKLEIPA